MLCNLSAVMQRAVHCNLIARVCQLSVHVLSDLWLWTLANKDQSPQVTIVPSLTTGSASLGPQSTFPCRDYHFIMLTPALLSAHIRTFEDCIIIIPDKRANICIKHVITQLSFIILSSLRTAQNISRMDGYQEPFIQEVECDAGMHPSWLKFWEYFRFLWKMRQIAPAATDKTCFQVCKEKEDRHGMESCWLLTNFWDSIYEAGEWIQRSFVTQQTQGVKARHFHKVEFSI